MAPPEARDVDLLEPKTGKTRGLLTLEETCAWVATQSVVAARLALDMEHLKDSLLDMQQRLEDSPAKCGLDYKTRAHIEAGLPVVEKEGASMAQARGDVDFGPPTLYIDTQHDGENARTEASSSTGLAQSVKSPYAKQRQTPTSTRGVASERSLGLGPVGESQAPCRQAPSHMEPQGEDCVTGVDIMDVRQLVADMAREKDLYAQSDSLDDDDSKTLWQCLGTEPERSGPLHDLIASMAFERTVALVIILNAAFIGYSLELTLEDPKFEQSEWTRAVEWVFMLFYMSEMALKLSVHRWYFFVNQNWAWNTVDFALVIVSLQEMFLADIGSDDTGFSVTFMRLVRLIRVTRLFRVFRVMFIFRDLRVMLRCIAGSMRSLLWAIVTLMSFYYIFAVIFVNGASQYARTHPEEHDIEPVMTWYGSIFTCMHSLYMASTGGADWHDIGRPLLKVGPVYYALFLFYIAFIVFAVLNIVTGIFVESAIQASRRDIEGRILSLVDQERSFEETLSGLFRVIDRDSNGFLAKDEFCGRLKEGAPWAFFTTLGLEVNDSSEFFNLLCSYLGAESLDAKGFVRGCRRFRSPAKYSDVFMLASRLAEMQGTLEKLQSCLDPPTPRTVAPEEVILSC